MSNINGTIMQYFHWYVPDNGMLWNKVGFKAKELSAAGFTGIWLPPAY